ncbi:unnamed protein product [Phytomonas sp. EM1]|nr:unnamed protein product [Phytomonas sp. EM1]|eukprot:CCW61213.1 unnamed protein product [Phytomonas sp. isolate EM1]
MNFCNFPRWGTLLRAASRLRPIDVRRSNLCLTCARLHISGTGREGSPSSPASLSNGDDTRAWFARQAEQSVVRGQNSKEAAAYFHDMLDDQPELVQFLKEARLLLRDQDPAGLTPYQRGLFLDRFGQYAAVKVSQRLQRARREEEAGKRFTQEGRPTGDQYWLESGNTLSLLEVPNYVKDEILKDMCKDRPEDSPAYEEPQEIEKMAAQNNEFAEHMRKQRLKRLSGVENSGKVD